jgi:hypothetical protein
MRDEEIAQTRHKNTVVRVKVESESNVHAPC